MYLTPSPDAAAGGLSAALPGSGWSFARPQRTTCTVLDTFDGRLAAAGLRLELRDAEQRELVLIGPAGSPPAHVDWPGPLPDRVGSLPAGPFGARIATVIVERALVPLLEVTSTARKGVRVDGQGKPTVAVVLHEDLQVGGGPAGSLPSCVAEVAAVAGHDSAAAGVVSSLGGVGWVPGDGDLADAVAVATGTSLVGHSSSPTVPLDRGDDAFEAFRAVLANLLASITANLPGTLADLDPEYLHDLRVAVRRTRSMLAEGKKVLPDEVRSRFREGFAEIGVATGRTRDLDVYVLGWDDLVAPLALSDPAAGAALLDEIEQRRRAAHGEMVEVLTAAPVRRLLDEWSTWLSDPAAGEHPQADHRAIGPYVARRIARAQDGLLRDGRAITAESPADRLHDLRKDAKKLRYLFECFGSLLPAKGRKSFVAQLKALQDNLGQHQDAEVQAAELRGLAHDLRDRRGIDTDTLLVAGRLVDQVEKVRGRERAAFATRFADYDTKANRHLLDGLLAAASQPKAGAA